MQIDTTIRKGRTSLTVKAAKGTLKIDCSADSLQHIVDSLKEVIKRKVHIRFQKVTIRQPVEVIKHRIPWWVWVLIALNAGYIYGKVTGKLRF